MCHLLALLGAHHILQVSRIRVKVPVTKPSNAAKRNNVKTDRGTSTCFQCWPKRVHLLSQILMLDEASNPPLRFHVQLFSALRIFSV